MHAWVSVLHICDNNAHDNEIQGKSDHTPQRRRTVALRMAKRITLRASDVAACIGKNPFKTPNEVLEALWQKHQKETFTLVTKDDVVQAALKNPEAERVFKAVEKTITKDSSETQKVFEDAAMTIKSLTTLSAEEKEAVLQSVRKTAYTNHGLRQEDATARKMSSEKGVRLEKDDGFYTEHICDMAGYEVFVTGKVDRIEQCPDGSKVLVEIKNRTKRLFHRLYAAENIQIQVYLQLLDLERGKLVEQYNSEVNTIEVNRDRDCWTNVIRPRLVEFATKLITILTDPVARDSYIVAAKAEGAGANPSAHPAKKAKEDLN